MNSAEKKNSNAGTDQARGVYFEEMETLFSTGRSEKPTPLEMEILLSRVRPGMD